jgi:uncharacterized protein YbbK (DUF523 family)
MKLISECLLGIKCDWRAGDSYKSGAAVNLAASEELLPVCPEQLGGLSSPRPQMEIVGGDGYDVLDGTAKVMTSEGVDVTAYMVAGANAVLKLARDKKITLFIGKARSPSCGCGAVYDGSFNGKTVEGDGVACALLKRNGITVITNDDI